MKKMILILGILAVMVMASGCINTSSNKTYSSNGISFTYPGDWDVQNNSDFQSGTGDVLVVVGNDKSAFALATTTVGKNNRLANTTEWANTFKSSMQKSGYTFIFGKPRTVDGVNGYEVLMKKAGNYTSNTYFVKNKTPYIAAFISSTDNGTETVNMVLNSLKVP